MAALWRPTLLALTRSTPCSGSASSPRPSSSSRSSAACSTRRAATAPSAAPSRAQVRGSRRVQFQVGALLALFATALFVAGVVFTERARDVPATGPAGLQAAGTEPLAITATGQQWLWRYDYPNQAFSYYRLVVPVDTTVALDLASTDVVHTWDVPALAGKRDAVPGKLNEVVFRADEEGIYNGQAATLSGQAYAAMRTEVEVVSPEEYEAFVERQKTDIQAAQDRVVELIESGETP